MQVGFATELDRPDSAGPSTCWWFFAEVGHCYVSRSNQVVRLLYR